MNSEFVSLRSGKYLLSGDMSPKKLNFLKAERPINPVENNKQMEQINDYY